MAPTLVEGIVEEAGAWFAGLAAPRPPFLVAPGDAAGGVEAGDLEELRLGGGEVRAVKVLAVDTISMPPRAKIVCLDSQEVLTVPVYHREEVERVAPEEQDVAVDSGQTTVYQDYEDAFSLAREVPATERLSLSQPLEQGGQSRDDRLSVMFQGLREEWNATVEDFREKGAVGALRDAALDACDVVGSVANVAAGTARAFAEGAMSSSCSTEAAPRSVERCANPHAVGS